MQDFDSKWPPFHNSFSYYLYIQQNKKNVSHQLGAKHEKFELNLNFD